MKPKSTILVVDDVPQNLAMVFDILTGAGHQVLVVESGELALQRIHALQPDLILLDVRLPGEDGYGICRKLKADSATADIPVIMMTALHDTSDMLRGFQVGAVDYVRKPVAPEEVLARANAHLQLRRLRAKLQQRNQELLEQVRRRREAERQLEQSLDKAIILVDPQGTVHFASNRAWVLVQKYFPDGPLGGLPQPLLQLAASVEDKLRVDGAHGQLSVQSFRNPNTDCLLLNLAEQLSALPADEAARLGLTPREAEVLHWLSMGKTSPEIASILDCAPNTIKKHAQRIYRKLEVDNRTSAALRATARD